MGWAGSDHRNAALVSVVTLAFGMVRDACIADYSMFYGSFGAGIATLIWLYIAAVSVLLGAELNGSLFGNGRERISGSGESGATILGE